MFRKKSGKNGLFPLILAVFATTTAGLLGSFYFFKDAPSAIAATCPFVDNDGNDADATVGVYRLNTNYSVPAVATAYDCTSGAGITTFIVPSSVTLTLQSNTGTGEIARMDFTNLTVNSGGAISADGKGCAWGEPSYAPNGSNVCTSGATGSAGRNGGGGGGGHGGPGGTSGFIAGLGGATYDSATAPGLFGAGGGASSSGAYGGGVVRLNVSGTFTHNGSITADGQSASGGSTWGGGAGGSIYVTAATINGTTGTYSADGGNGAGGTYYGGGGGGGRIAITYTGGSVIFGSGDFTVAGGTSGGGAAVAGAKGTVYVVNTQGTGPATDDEVTIYHGFTYQDVDYAAGYWIVDSSATNQYCDSSAISPSITAGTIKIGGTLTCGPNTIDSGQNATGLTSFNLSASTSFEALASTSWSVTNTNADMDWNIPAGNNQTWTGVTIASPVEGDFTIDDAIAITLSGSTAVYANARWTALTALTIDSGSSINATAKGCRISATDIPSYAPNGSNVCSSGATGSASRNGGGGGGGHGGAGGTSGFTSGLGGATYDSATAPVLYGASGAGAITAGAGGGIVRLTVSGTLTNNGAVRADAGSATVSSTYGGGAGGSVYIQTGTYACSSAPTISAVGGNGAGSAYYGGGGGGGRVRIEYASDTCSSQPLSGLSASTVVAGGASGGGAAVAGATGSLSVLNTDNPPVVSVAVAANPATPNVIQQVTISATFTDDNGVNQIKLFLNGTADPANVVRTCTFSPAQSPATCSYNIGTQSDGPHTIRATARDTSSQTTDSDGSFTVGSFTTAGTMTLSRLKAGVTNVDFALQFTLVGPDTAPLTVTFPSGFTVTQAFTSGTCSGGGTVTSFGFTSLTLTATKTACIGTVTLSGAKITNHSTPGVYVVNWTNDSGSGSVVITSEDQVDVTASIDPTLTFNVGSQAAATACDGTFAGAGGAVGLGTLTTAAVSSSDVASVPHICTRLTTNGTAGAIATVRSANAGLKSASAPSDVIASSSATLVAGTAGYGLCAGSAGGDSGRDSTVPVGVAPAAASPFNGSCTASGHAVGSLTTLPQTVWSLSGPSQNAFFRLWLKAAISPTTVAHTDYADTLTFVATGTY
ncbi:MAG: hypothetical protein RL272_560 [Candidatus Parcubacteria bacterium]|jgi:hypothetical protein